MEGAPMQYTGQKTVLRITPDIMNSVCLHAHLPFPGVIKLLFETLNHGAEYQKFIFNYIYLMNILHRFRDLSASS